jgi:hypothetical protein
MHRWNPLFKGFILSHFERVGCVGHHGVLESTGTVGINTIFCGVPQTYPPKQEMSTTTLILMLSSKSMHCWNPPFKGFILSHFEQVGCVVQHGLLIHTIVRNSEFNVRTCENMY